MTEKPPVVVPIEGQSFSSEQDWINRATRCLTSHPEYLDTAHSKVKGWRGHHFTALCFDQAGNRMRNGGDFMRATAEGTYPVWWIWPDQITALVIAGVEHRMEVAAHSATRFKLDEAEKALATCRQTITDQRDAVIEPGMPLLSAEAVRELEEDAETSYAMADTRIERVAAQGLLMLMEWQSKLRSKFAREGLIDVRPFK